MRETYPQKALRELLEMLEDAPFPDEGRKKDSNDVLDVIAWRLNLDVDDEEPESKNKKL